MDTTNQQNARSVDALAVLRRHALSHNALAVSDAYSAQEAPRLARAYDRVAELIDKARSAARALEDSDDPKLRMHGRMLMAAAERAGGAS